MTQQIDWRMVIHRLRPPDTNKPVISYYHWKGDGVDDSYVDIGQWRDPETTKPTKQECLDEWDIYQAEVAAEDAEVANALNAIKTTAQSAVGVALADLTAGQIKALVAIQLYKSGAVDRATLTIRPLSEWV